MLKTGWMPEPTQLLRRIPQVEHLLSSPELAPLLAAYPREQVVRRVREVLGALRSEIANGTVGDAELESAAIAERTAALLASRFARYYRRVVNATGVILHTNLGRAPLARQAADAVAELGPHAQRLEIDLETGGRGGRDRGCAELLVELVGCEDATVVNNNAAATLLILAALARGRRVVVSRGELVEIGGSYRVPEILAESGALLAEVGTTNRTHLADYRRALDEAEAAGEPAGLLLKVHTSNYRVVGFTAEVELAEIAALGRERGVPVVHDLGSGSLIDLAARGRPGEQPVRDAVAAGADLVCFSGDKLLGGPQAGVIVGRRDAVARCRSHPLFRAVRPGRLTYSALEATLRIYLRGEEAAVREIPALSRLLATEDELAARAGALASGLAGTEGIEATVVDCASQAGSGSLPVREYPSRGVRVEVTGLTATELADRLRSGEPAVVARVHDGAVLFDLRTMDDEDAEIAAERLREIRANQESVERMRRGSRQARERRGRFVE